MMRGLGAEVVLVEQAANSSPGRVSGADLALVVVETERIVADRGAFRADQFRLESSARAREPQTGPEMIRQSGGRIDAFCDFVGSGGTFAGFSANANVAAALRLLRGACTGATIAVVICDSGLKCLSTDLWTAEA